MTTNSFNMRPRVIAVVHLVLVIITVPFSTAVPMNSNAVALVKKRTTNGNQDKDRAGQLIPGSVPIQTRIADNLHNSETLITAPAQALHLTNGDIYAPSIMAAESGGALTLQLGNSCTISGDRFNSAFCSIIEESQITIRTYLSSGVRTLYFSITVDDNFIGGQANMTVTFIHIASQIDYNISGYLYFDSSQPNDGCDPSTQPPHTSDIPVQCNCPMTGSSNQTTGTHCQEQAAKVVSGSKLHHMALPVLVAASVLYFVT